MGLNRLKKLQNQTKSRETGQESGGNTELRSRFAEAKQQAAANQAAAKQQEAKSQAEQEARAEKQTARSMAAQLPGGSKENKVHSSTPFSPTALTRGSTTDSMIAAAASRAQATKTENARQTSARTPKKQLEDAITGLERQRHRTEETGTRVGMTEGERADVDKQIAELDKQITTLKNRMDTLPDSQLNAGESEIERAARESKALRQARNRADLDAAAGAAKVLFTGSQEARDDVRAAMERRKGAEKEIRETRANEYSAPGRVMNTLIGAAGQTAGSLLEGAAVTQDIATGGSGKNGQSPIEDEEWRQAFINYLDAQNRQDPRKVASDALYNAAGSLMDASALSIAKAKANAPKLGQIAVDTGVAGAQMAGDIAVTALTKVPSAGLASMAARAFGGSAYQAMEEGATAEQAAAYGLLSSAIEVMTEKVASTSLPFAKAYGGGTLDAAIERAVSRGAAKLAKTEKGRAAVEMLLKTAASGGIEGMEEVLSDLLNPIAANLTYTSGETADLEQTIEDFFVGALLGLAGTGTQTLLSAPEKLRRGKAADELNGALEEAVANARQDAEEQAAMEAPVFTAAPTTDSQEIYRRQLSVQRAGASLGENGAKALKASYDEGTAAAMDDAQAFSGFAQVYNAALKGKKTDKAEAMALPEHMRLAAENAAQRDRAKAAQAAYFGRDAGLVPDRLARRAKLTRKDRQVLDSAAKILGVQVKFAETVAEGRANAQYENGVITIALDAQDPVRTAFLHEAVHRVREAAPEAYSALANFVQENMSSGAAEFALQRRAVMYNSMDVSALSEEMVADAFGRMLGDSEGLVRFARRDRNAAQRLLDAILDLIDRVKTALGRKDLRLTKDQMAEFRDLEGRLGEMEETLQGALEKAHAQGRIKENAASEGGRKSYSLKAFEDGTRFVDVQTEQEQFDGLSDAQKSKLAVQVIKNKFIGKVIGIDNQVFVNGKSAAEYGHPVKRLSPEFVNAKMRASTELDNLLDAGMNFRTEADGRDGHVHPDATGDFRYFDTIFKVGDAYYKGVINIKPTERGLLLKDVTKIENITQDLYSSYGNNPKSVFLRDVSMTNVSQNGENVKRKFSMKEGDRYIVALDDQNIEALKKELTWNEAEDLLNAQKGMSYRFYAKDDPMSRAGYAMFADDPDSNGYGYGGSKAKAFSVSEEDLIDIGDLKEKIIAARHETDENEPWVLEDYADVDDWDFAELFDPGDIVDSAAAWDNEDLAEWFSREVAEYDIGGIKTWDGAIVFDEKLIKRNIPAEIVYEQYDSEEEMMASGRFSLKETVESREALKARQTLERENRALKEKVDYWKGQTKRTKLAATDKKAVAKAAKELIRAYGAEVEAESVRERMQALYDYMAAGEQGKDELTFTEAKRRAEDIARDIAENAVEENDEMYRTYAGLRERLKKAGLVISEENSRDVANYGERQRANRSRVQVKKGARSNVDQVYKELAEEWPEFFDEEAVTHPADQLAQIFDVAEDIYQVTAYNPFSMELDQATEGIAAEILEGFFDLPQAKATFADKQARRLDAAKAKGKAETAQAKEAGKERLAREREKNKEKMAKLREQNKERVAKVREKRDEKIKALNEEWKEKLDRAVLGEKMAGGRELAKEKRLNKERVAKAREKRAARVLRARILRHTKDMAKKLLTPTDKQHVPESLRGVVRNVLMSINQESKYTVAADGKRVTDGSGSPTRRTAAFIRLKEQLQNMQDDLVLDPALFGDAAEAVQGKLDAVIAMADIWLDEMNTEQLQEVWTVIRAVEAAISKAGKTLALEKYENTKEWADAVHAAAVMRRSRATTGRHFSLDLETPYTFFSQFGEAGEAFFRMLRGAQDAQMLMKARMEQETADIVKEKTVKRLEKETVELATERGEKLTLTKAQAMELYLLTKRPQARDHLLKGGVMQPEVKRGKAQRGTQAVKLTAEDLSTVKNLLTAEETELADKLQALTTGALAEYGNEASMRAYGYRKFTEEAYWPIQVAKEGVHADTGKVGEWDRSIKNTGMAQATKANASNELELHSIFDTFARHTSDMVDYAAWLCPMEDASRLFNFRFRDENGILTGLKVNGLIDQVAGARGQECWKKLMRDIQNGIKPRNDNAWGAAASRLYGNAKGAAVGANVRVVIQQPTAWMRAGLVMNPADMTAGLAKGATKGNGWKKAEKWAPIAMRKAEGGFDISNPATMKESLFGGAGVLRKVSDAAGIGAARADEITWGKLWNACEWETARKQKALEKGSDAFYRATARRFAEVIDQTQVVDGVLQRSNIMRSGNQLTQMATSFRGEPIMSLNMVMRAWDQVRYSATAQGRKAGKKALARAAVVYLINAAVNGLAQSIIDAIRDDDRDKKYWERFWASYFGLTGEEENLAEQIRAVVLDGNLVSGMNPLSGIPYLGDALSLIQGYSVERMDMSRVSDFLSAGKSFIENVGGSGPKTQAYAIKQLFASGAAVLGLPVGNLTRDVWSGLRTWANDTDNIPMQYMIERAIYNESYEGNAGRYYAVMFQALKVGDYDSYKKIREELMTKAGIEGPKIDSAMKSRYKKAREDDPDYTLPKEATDLFIWRSTTEKDEEDKFDAGDLTAAEYTKYAEKRGKNYRTTSDMLDRYLKSKGISTEEQEKAYASAQKLAEDTALMANSKGRYTEEDLSKWEKWAINGDEAGVDEAEAILFKLAYDTTESDKDEDGKAISGSKKEKTLEKADVLMPWLTDEELQYLMDFYWQSK